MLRRLRRDNAQLESENFDLSQDKRELERLTVELERSNSDLERFAYVASHDLSEPLRAISAFSLRLADRYEGRLDAEADEYLHFILDGAERLRALIQALLAYSRLNQAALKLERVDTQELVEEVLAAFGTAQISHVEARELPTIVADRSQLGQVFQNLLANAVKFVDHEDPQARVAATREQDGWRFDVADNGIGIEPRYADRIFEVFERLHTREKYEGTGIGLSICRRVVERHGGNISVSPGDAGGTVFSFTIPDQEPS